MLGFLSGIAKGAGDELDTQEAQAFKLKLQNAQIEGELANARKMSEFERAGEVATSDMSGGLQEGRANKADQQWWMSKNTNDAKRQAAMSRGTARGMTVGEFKKINDIDIPGKDTDWLSPAAIDAYKFRLRSEASPASVKANYAGISNGINLLETLRKLRAEAVNESPVGGGPVAGRAMSIAAKAEKGMLFPKTAKYLAMKQANLAGIAELMGEKGRKAEGDIERADKAVPGLEYDPKAADEIFNAVLSIGRFNKENLEYQFSDLKRKKERAEDAELGTVSGKEGELSLKEKIQAEKARRAELKALQAPKSR